MLILLYVFYLFLLSFINILAIRNKKNYLKVKIGYKKLYD